MNQHVGNKPLFSIVVPVCDPEPAWLQDCINSVRAQSYPGWELILSDDGSQKPSIQKILKKAKWTDRRIHLVSHKFRTGISACTNRGEAKAVGDYLVFLDHDDMFDQFALSAFVESIRDAAPNSPPDIIYADEDRFDEKYNRLQPGFKPSFSSEKLLSTNYIHHPVVIRRTLFEELGGLRERYDGSQDHDLLLRAEEVTKRIVHIPDVLYHMRLHAGSLSSGPQAKPDAHHRDRLLIADALRRRGIEGEVRSTLDGFPGHHTVWRRKSSKDVTIIIVDDPENHFINMHQEWTDCEYLRVAHDPNWIVGLNAAAHRAKGEFLLFASSAIFPDSTWRHGILPHLERSGIGLVSGKIVYHDNRLHNCGHVLGIAGAAGRWHHQCNAADPGYGGWMSVPHEVSAVSWRFMGVQKHRFLDMGGFDPSFSANGFDIDLGLRLTHEKGLYHLVIPDVIARLCEGFPENELEKWSIHDFARLWQRWGSIIRQGDPYLNPNFSLLDEGVHLINFIENDLRASGCFSAYDLPSTLQLYRRFNRGMENGEDLGFIP